MNGFLLVAIGGALGTALRYSAGLLAMRHNTGEWPLASFAVNISGSLLMGILVGWLAMRNAGENQEIHLLLAVGLLGGFTTFSTFALEVVQMARLANFGGAAVYAGLSLFAGILAIYAGMLLSTWFL